MNYEIKVFSELNSELRECWRILEKESYNYCFQSFEWFENWINNYRSDNVDYSLRIVIVSLQSKVLCILPFEIEKKSSLKILKWAGGEQADYCSPILSKDFNLDKKSFKYLWQKIINSIPGIDIIYLKNQPRNIEEVENPFVLFLKNYRDSSTYNILLPETWEEYTDKIIKKNFLSQNYRKEKQLKKVGNLEFKIATTDHDKIKFMEELIIQKNARLFSQGIKDSFKPKDLNFYKEFENKNLKNLKTHISSLVLNNELIAVHWGVVYNNRFYYLVLSMKEGNLDRYSPGRLLISSLIRWAIKEKIKIFDFTLGDEDYKKSWSNNTGSLFNHIQVNTLNGFLLFLLIKIKLILKSFSKKNYLKKIILTIKKIF